MTSAAIDSITVRVPATSANLGVGFDVLGLALNLFASYSFKISDALRITGIDEGLCGPDNLVWTSYLTACDELAVPSHALHIHEDCPIPASGGLGSSSTCVVAGIVAAQVLSGHPLDRQFTLDLATRIEGHPDNVAPAVMGGLVSSYVGGGITTSTRWPIAPSLRFVCIAPSYRVLTVDARRVLPSIVPMGSVSWQVGRCLAMVSALASGDPEAIGACCHDRVHEPYRATLIPDFERLQTCALDAGAATFLISGSGAAMLALCADDESAARVEQAVAKEAPDFWVQTMRASEKGVSVQEHN